MRFIFDIQDEENILKQMSGNRNKAESMAQTCVQQGKAKQAAKWIASAQQVGARIMLLEQAFQQKN